MRLIDADALMATLGITDMDCNKCAWHDREWSNCKRGGDFEDACCAIENAPTIEERKTGKLERKSFYDSTPVCPECGIEVRWDYEYCPYCGTKLEGEEHG